MAGGAVVVLVAMALAEFWPGGRPVPAQQPPPIPASSALDIRWLARAVPPAAPTSPPRVVEFARGVSAPPRVPAAPVPAPVSPVVPAAVEAPAAAANPVAAAPAAAIAPSIRAELIDAHERWFTAYARGDAARLAELEADGFRLIDSRPPAERVSRTAGVARTFERLSVDVSGDAMVLAGRMTERIAAPAADSRTVLSEISEVWTPSGAGWRLLGLIIRPAS
jgi:hypothetical protein